MFLVQEQPTVSYLLKSSIIFIACLSLLLFIFVPKVIIQRRSSVTKLLGEASSDSQQQVNIDASSMGFGIRVVRSPAISSAQTELDDALRERIRELEHKVLQLEGENSTMKQPERASEEMQRTRDPMVEQAEEATMTA